MSLPHAQRKRTMSCSFILGSRPLGRDQKGHRERTHKGGQIVFLTLVTSKRIAIPGPSGHGGSEFDGGPAVSCHLA